MIRIIRLIGSVLIVLVVLFQEFLSIMHLRICFLETVNGLEQLLVRLDIQLFFLLALFLASKIEGKKVEDYGISGRGKDWGYLVGGLVGGIGVFLLITSPLYLIGAYRLDSGNANIVPLITSFILFIAVGYPKSFYSVAFFSTSCLDLVH